MHVLKKLVWMFNSCDVMCINKVKVKWKRNQCTQQSILAARLIKLADIYSRIFQMCRNSGSVAVLRMCIVVLCTRGRMCRLQCDKAHVAVLLTGVRAMGWIIAQALACRRNRARECTPQISVAIRSKFLTIFQDVVENTLHTIIITHIDKTFLNSLQILTPHKYLIFGYFAVSFGFSGNILIVNF